MYRYLITFLKGQFHETLAPFLWSKHFIWIIYKNASAVLVNISFLKSPRLRGLEMFVYVTVQYCKSFYTLVEHFTYYWVGKLSRYVVSRIVDPWKMQGARYAQRPNYCTYLSPFVFCFFFVNDHVRLWSLSCAQSIVVQYDILPVNGSGLTRIPIHCPAWIQIRFLKVDKTLPNT